MDTYRVVVEACSPIIREFDNLSDLLEFTDTLYWNGVLLYEYNVYEGDLDLPPAIRDMVLSQVASGATIEV